VLWVVVIAAAVTLLDQFTKWWIVRALDFNESVAVFPGFFHLVHWRNTGAAWGIFPDSNTILTVVSLLTILVLYFLRHTFQLHRTPSRIAFGLIAGGIIGNLIDRLRFHSVVDFLDFHLAGRHWPAFNVADSAICVGVVLYVIISWRVEKNADKPSPFEKERSRPVIHF
jgi:signal peptidase II